MLDDCTALAPPLLPSPHYNRATRRASGRDRTVRRRRGRSRSEDAPVSGGCCGRRAGLPSAARGPVRGVGAHPSPDLYDLGVDRRDPVVAGHRDAVVSVPNEVGAADLVEAHGGQLLPPLVRAVYAAPPLAHALLEGQKGRVEVPVPADAPRYFLDLDRTYAAVGLPAPCQGALRLVERDRDGSDRSPSAAGLSSAARTPSAGRDENPCRPALPRQRTRSSDQAKRVAVRSPILGFLTGSVCRVGVV